MSYHNLHPRINEEDLNDYGKRQYSDFEASKSRVKQFIDQKYSDPKRGLTIRQLSGAAAAIALILGSWWLLRPVPSSAEAQLAQLIESEREPIATLGESGYRDAGDRSDLFQAISFYQQEEYDKAGIEFGRYPIEAFNAQQALYYGHVLFMQEKYEKAILALSHGLELESTNQDIAIERLLMYWKAKTFAAKGRCDLALQQIESITPPSEPGDALQEICLEVTGQP